MIQKPHCILLDAWSPVILCERNLWVMAMNVSWYSLSQYRTAFKDTEHTVMVYLSSQHFPKWRWG